MKNQNNPFKRHCGLHRGLRTAIDPQSPENKSNPSRSGDGGSLSAMTVKGSVLVLPLLFFFDFLS